MASTTNKNVLVWLEDSPNITRNISGNLSGSYGIFATINGDIYVDNGNSHQRVDKWTLNATSSVAVMNVSDRCDGLFVDSNNTLYCSMESQHKVVKKSLDDNGTTSILVAGTGTPGNRSDQLDDPRRIFVDIQFNLYVADKNNNRIQKFTPGQLNATTVAINGSTATISLYRPTGIVLDADNYLFIVDWGHNRIVGQGPDGFRCLIGCSGSIVSSSDPLSGPVTFSFDSYGNMFVADINNHRIQKFLLSTNSCSKFIRI